MVDIEKTTLIQLGKGDIKMSEKCAQYVLYE